MAFVRTHRFYQHDHLITELNGQMARSVFRHKHGLLAQDTFSDVHSRALMSVSDTDSVMTEYSQGRARQRTYDPYGLYPVAQDASQAPLAFNGQRLDLIAEGYLLGNGYRLFSPALRRFCSPDSLSPFGRGGSNAYVYCAGDPVNFSDPTGESPSGNVIRLDANWSLKRRHHYPALPEAAPAPSFRSQETIRSEKKTVRWGHAYTKNFEASESTDPILKISNTEDFSYYLSDKPNRIISTRIIKQHPEISIRDLAGLPDLERIQAAAYLRAAKNRKTLIKSDARSSASDTYINKEFVAAHKEYRTLRSTLKKTLETTTNMNHAKKLRSIIRAGN